MLTALQMIKGVAAIEPATSSVELHITVAREDGRWRQRVNDLLRETG